MLVFPPAHEVVGCPCAPYHCAAGCTDRPSDSQPGPQVNRSQAEEWVWPAKKSQLEMPQITYTFKHGSHQCPLCCSHFTTLEGTVTGFSSQEDS